MEEFGKLVKQVNDGTMPPIAIEIEKATIINLCLAIAIAGIVIICVNKLLK